MIRATILACFRPCFKSSDLSLRSRRQHKAWGVSPRRLVIKGLKPTKWATADSLPPVSRAQWLSKPDPGFRLRPHPGLYAGARFAGFRKELLKYVLSCLAAIMCAVTTLAADATVAPSGDGQFKSIQDAIMAAPQGLPSADRPWVIHVKPGVYKELVYVQRERRYIKLEGEDAANTIITFNLNANLAGLDGKPIGTFRTPSAQIDGDGFAAENITFENTAGPVGQALALRVDGDRVSFKNCRFLGWQDTILLNRGRQYFENCYIAGHVDFIFGAATAFF